MRGLVAVGVASGVALYAALAISSMRGKSGTFDEAVHLPPGYMSLTLGDHRMNPDHPPLLRRLAALPLLGLDVKFRAEDEAWRSRRPWEFGRRFLYRWNDADALLFRGRLVVVALGAVSALGVFFWTRRCWGLPAAFAALFFTVLSPDMLAHGQVVTNDLAVTLFMFASVVAFERLLERATYVRLAFAGLVVGCALATKYSAIGLVLLIGGPALALAVSGAPMLLDFGRAGSTARPLTTPGGRLAAFAAFSVIVAVIAVAVIWSAYGFRSPTSLEPEVDAAFDRSRVQPEGPAVAAAFQWLERSGLLPEAYLYGFQRFLAHTEARPAFLMGRLSETGWWYYFPVTFALKTPVALLLLLLAAAILAWKRPGPLRQELFLWLPPALYMALSMTRGINIGHRHLLPIYPFVFVAAGRAAGLALSHRKAVTRAAVIALGAWYAASAARIHPHYLAYFNELAGGPGNGYKYLVDSNLDWGQDLPGLKAFMERNGIHRIKLSYFGTAEPEYYGIECDRLPGYMTTPTFVREVRPGDIVAVSATNLQGVYLDREVRPLMDRLRAMKPIAVIGYSIFVYRAEFAWSLP